MPAWGDKNFASEIAYVILEIRFFVAMQPTMLIQQVTDQCRKCIYIQGYFGIFAGLIYIGQWTGQYKVSLHMLEYSFHGLRICVVQIALCPAKPVIWLNSDSGHYFPAGFFFMITTYASSQILDRYILSVLCNGTWHCMGFGNIFFTLLQSCLCMLTDLYAAFFHVDRLTVCLLNLLNSLWHSTSHGSLATKVLHS